MNCWAIGTGIIFGLVLLASLLAGAFAIARSGQISQEQERLRREAGYDG